MEVRSERRPGFASAAVALRFYSCRYDRTGLYAVTRVEGADRRSRSPLCALAAHAINAIIQDVEELSSAIRSYGARHGAIDRARLASRFGDGTQTPSRKA